MGLFHLYFEFTKPLRFFVRISLSHFILASFQNDFLTGYRILFLLIFFQAIYYFYFMTALGALRRSMHLGLLSFRDYMWVAIKIAII